MAPKGFWHNQHVSLALRAVPLTRTFSAANAATPGKAVPTRRGRASLLGTLLGGAGPHAGSVPPCLNHVPARNPDCRHKLTLPQCTPQYPTNLGLQASSQSGAQRWVWPCEVSGTPSLTPDLGCVLSSGLPRLCPPAPGTKGSQTSGQHQEGSRGHGVHGARVMWSPELGTCMRTSNPVPMSTLSSSPQADQPHPLAESSLKVTSWSPRTAVAPAPAPISWAHSPPPADRVINRSSRFMGQARPPSPQAPCNPLSPRKHPAPPSWCPWEWTAQRLPLPLALSVLGPPEAGGCPAPVTPASSVSGAQSQGQLVVGSPSSLIRPHLAARPGQVGTDQGRTRGLERNGVPVWQQQTPYAHRCLQDPWTSI